jgi:hypothetical protein
MPLGILLVVRYSANAGGFGFLFGRELDWVWLTLGGMTCCVPLLHLFF